MGSQLKSKKRDPAANLLVRKSAFGPAPILSGEDSDAYNSLLADISTKVGPSDILEQLWVRDVVDLRWEMSRWRRYQTLLIESAIPEALEEILAPLVNGDHRFGAMERWRVDGSREPTPAMELVNEWIAQKPAAIERVYELLTSIKLSMEAVRARASLIEIDRIEQIDRLITNAESRQYRVLNEIDFRREIARKMRKVIDAFQDNEKP